MFMSLWDSKEYEKHAKDIHWHLKMIENISTHLTTTSEITSNTDSFSLLDRTTVDAMLQWVFLYLNTDLEHSFQQWACETLFVLLGLDIDSARVAEMKVANDLCLAFSDKPVISSTAKSHIEADEAMDVLCHQLLSLSSGGGTVIHELLKHDGIKVPQSLTLELQKSQWKSDPKAWIAQVDKWIQEPTKKSYFSEFKDFYLDNPWLHAALRHHLLKAVIQSGSIHTILLAYRMNAEFQAIYKSSTSSSYDLTDYCPTQQPSVMKISQIVIESWNATSVDPAIIKSIKPFESSTSRGGFYHLPVEIELWWFFIENLEFVDFVMMAALKEDDNSITSTYTDFIAWFYSTALDPTYKAFLTQTRSDWLLDIIGKTKALEFDTYRSKFLNDPMLSIHVLVCLFLIKEEDAQDEILSTIEYIMRRVSTTSQEESLVNQEMIVPRPSSFKFSTKEVLGMVESVSSRQNFVSSKLQKWIQKIKIY